MLRKRGAKGKKSTGNKKTQSQGEQYFSEIGRGNMSQKGSTDLSDEDLLDRY